MIVDTGMLYLYCIPLCDTAKTDVATSVTTSTTTTTAVFSSVINPSSTSAAEPVTASTVFVMVETGMF